MYHYRGDINDVYPRIVRDIVQRGTKVETRGTHTLELHPVSITLDNTNKRLITSYGRPVNVAFALAEVLWILSGRRDVEFLSKYNSRISQFSDNGRTFNAPYGYRMRAAHGYDQLEDAIATLREDPGSRQAVLAVWHPEDRGWFQYPSGYVRRETKDRACNIVAHPMIREGKLDWLQVIRSNDAILGLPYNIVQWTHIQAYMAARLGIKPGTFNYVADSLHLYEDTYYDEKAHRVNKFSLHKEFGEEYAVWPSLRPEEVDSLLALVLNHEWGIWNSHEAEVPSVYVWKAVPVYWQTALYLFLAHRLYKERRDYAAANLLVTIPLDQVLQAAQFRFYYHSRWNRLVKPWSASVFAEMAYDTWGPSIGDWVIGKQNG